MRQAIGGTWVLSIVIVFIMIFIAYVSIQMNYSIAYRLKTDIVTIIEQDDGFNDNSIKHISNRMYSEGYKSKGYCGSLKKNATHSQKVYGVNDTTPIEVKNGEGPFQYCITRTKQIAADAAANKNRYYYTVVVFFGFSLPVLGNIYTFNVNGETNVVYYPHDSYF